MCLVLLLSLIHIYMNLEQMKYRCPAAEVVENVRLENYRLAFRGRAPGNGVATVLPEKGSCVEGVLWKITEAVSYTHLENNIEKEIQEWVNSLNLK